MKGLIFIILISLVSYDTHSSSIYKCEDASGRIIFRDTPCDGQLKGKQASNTKTKKEELSGERLDKVMWALLEKPYNSHDKLFIDYVKSNNLIGKKDSDGDTVLSVAAINGQVGVIEYLLENGAEINSTNYSGYTIFSFATKLTHQVNTALVKNGANINHFGEYAHTPLINAALAGDLNTVKFLISLGAVIDHLDERGGSALFYAASGGNIEMVKSMVEAGADVNIGTEYRPLKGAIANSHYLVSTYLVLQGAEQ